MPMPMPMYPACLLLMAFASGATAAAVPRPLDRLSLSLGGFEADSDTTISARGGTGGFDAAGSFNLEDDLGLDQRQPVVHARLDFLTTADQGVALEYFGYRRENETRISRRIVYEDRTWEASARVHGRMDYDFASAAYRWWFGERSTVYGLGLGVAYYRVDTLLEGEATLDGETVHASTASSDAALAPLLALGWRHAWSEHLRTYADLSGVAKDGGPLEGHIIDAAIGMEWFPARRLGLALEYGHTRIRLTRERDQYDARLDLVLRGPTLFLRIR